VDESASDAYTPRSAAHGGRPRCRDRARSPCHHGHACSGHGARRRLRRSGGDIDPRPQGRAAGNDEGIDCHLDRADALGLASTASIQRRLDALPRAAGTGAGTVAVSPGRRFRGDLSPPAPTSSALRALGTTALLAVRRPESLDRARAVLQDELEAVDRACSRFRDDSDLVRLNRAAGKQIEVGPYLLAALGVAVTAAAGTDGAVDPTVGKALRLAGYDRTFSLVRLRDGHLVHLSSAPGGAWRQIEVDREHGTARIPAGVELDLGATAKALAADRAALAAAEATDDGVLVSLGGDVAVAGDSPAAGWSVGLADDHAAPFPADGPTVAVQSGGLATSGTCVRAWATATGRAHHIIDPRTGAPAETPWRTVSVAAASCVDANTASTAAIVFGDEAPDWLARRRLPARLVRNDGSVVCVAGWPSEAAA
jgi:thiamine biosynthesis lipoprotein